MLKLFPSQARTFIFGLICMALSTSIQHAKAETLATLHTFKGGTRDGAGPYAPLLLGQDGKLYGTVASGGKNGGGAVFRLTLGGKEELLYSFSAGSDPTAGLIQDAAGNFFGTDNRGGTLGQGEIFELSAGNVFTSLHSFTSAEHSISVVSRLVADQQGNLLGLAGKNAFKYAADGKLTIIHMFGGKGDGDRPVGDPILDAAGNLLGVTLSGGAHHDGTIFKIAPNGTETVLYSFMGQTDGGDPLGGLVSDPDGNLYGTTIGLDGSFFGTVFKYSASGVMTVLHSFPARTSAPDDGNDPSGSLVFDGNGNLFGTTEYGGGGRGTVFEVSAAGAETVLHAFTGGVDGDFPMAGLLIGKKGQLYGTASSGGQRSKACIEGCGITFVLSR